MSHYTDEPLIEIVGIEASGRGRSCEAHKVCGSALQLDTTVRFRTIQILNGKFFVSAFVFIDFSTFVFVNFSCLTISFFFFMQTMASKKQPSEFTGWRMALTDALFVSSPSIASVTNTNTTDMSHRLLSFFVIPKVPHNDNVPIGSKAFAWQLSFIDLLLRVVPFL